jgi:hypothetical protein
MPCLTTSATSWNLEHNLDVLKTLFGCDGRNRRSLRGGANPKAGYRPRVIILRGWCTIKMRHRPSRHRDVLDLPPNDSLGHFMSLPSFR